MSMGYHSPSASSRSSSPAYDLDSSPPSSPSHTPYTVDAPESLFSHPFAGSTRAKFKFRQYEKKPVSVAAYDAFSAPMTRYRSMDEQSINSSDDLPSDKYTHMPSTSTERDTSIMKPEIARARWDTEITAIVENPSCINEIDLNGSFIGYIPHSISDLNKVVVLPQDAASVLTVASAARRFARAATSPIVFQNPRLGQFVERTGSLDRWKSSSFSKPNKPGQLLLSLASCGIRTLPRELFRLELLISLDLRSNLLTYLPPQINQLHNLERLDVSINHLKFLPSELLDMNLIACNVNANPFIPKPSSRSSRLRSPITRIKSQIPSLQEHCFRVLFRPYFEGGQQTGETNIQMIYGLPLESRWRLSDPTREILASCDPKAVSTRKRAKIGFQGSHDDVQQAPTGLSICPSPAHSHGARSIFADHVEERFTWETRIGVTRMHEPVPVIWRGCSWGCLSFLGDDDYDDDEVEKEKSELSDWDSEVDVNLVRFDAGRSLLTFSDDEGMEL